MPELLEKEKTLMMEISKLDDEICDLDWMIHTSTTLNWRGDSRDEYSFEQNENEDQNEYYGDFGPINATPYFDADELEDADLELEKVQREDENENIDDIFDVMDEDSSPCCDDENNL